jgi:hypothetical protein
MKRPVKPGDAPAAELETAGEDAERRRKLREQFLEMTREAEAHFDLDAALEVHESGWTHE